MVTWVQQTLMPIHGESGNCSQGEKVEEVVLAQTDYEASL